MNLSVIGKAFNVLRKGECLANPAVWKTGGLALSAAIGALLVSINDLAKALGYDLQITSEVAGALGVVGAWGVGLYFTLATSDKVGLPPKPGPVDGKDPAAPPDERA